MQDNSNHDRSNAGFGMMATVVAIAVVSIVVFIIVRYLASSAKTDQALAIKYDDELVAQFVKKNFSCKKTFAALDASVCGTPGSWVSLLDYEGRTLTTAARFGRVGAYELRASCPNTPSEILIEARRTQPRTNAPAVDPLSGRELDWFDPFRGIPVAVKTGTFGEKLDFETVPGVTEGRRVDDAMNEYFRQNYGVSFIARQGGDLAFARIVGRSEPRPSFEAWMSILCPGGPNRNRLCNGGDGGRWLLSTIGSLSTNTIEFDIVYETPVKKLSFDLADFDGSETWSLTPYDAEDNVLQHVTGPGSVEDSPAVFNASRGYNRRRTGNNAMTRISLETPDGSIQRLNVRGTKSIRLFGFGFDNFETGISGCLGDES